jgi:hypothetical protein
MINVELVNYGILKDPEVITFSAKTCYSEDIPAMGMSMDIENVLFKTGHHTTLQHSYYTFAIKNIAISDVTFGLHLDSPFYNSDQRSGRFCGKMFKNPDFDFIDNYLKYYWLKDEKKRNLVLSFVKNGFKAYQDNLEEATMIAKEFIKKERPFASVNDIEKNALKFAQEQLRVFVPTIFPTAFVYTINLSALISFYQVAWSPPLVDVAQKMVNFVLSKNPEFGYMFVLPNKGKRYTEQFFNPERSSILTSPSLKLLSLGNVFNFVKPAGDDCHPVDLLHFDPAYMNNNLEEVKTEIEVSLITMGQDQRHRTIKRGNPKFTGNFYLPPILQELGLDNLALSIMDEWLCLPRGDGMLTMAPPYGAMVSYKKSATYNALIHEVQKRLCWCAQEEIFKLNLNLRGQASQEANTRFVDFIDIFSPSCITTGKCGEGARYCGRNLKDSCFIERKV